jgi:hypothetical protein
VPGLRLVTLQDASAVAHERVASDRGEDMKLVGSVGLRSRIASPVDLHARAGAGTCNRATLGSMQTPEPRSTMRALIASFVAISLVGCPEPQGPAPDDGLQTARAQANRPPTAQESLDRGIAQMKATSDSYAAQRNAQAQSQQNAAAAADEAEKEIRVSSRRCTSVRRIGRV